MLRKFAYYSNIITYYSNIIPTIFWHKAATHNKVILAIVILKYYWYSQSSRDFVSCLEKLYLKHQKDTFSYTRGVLWYHSGRSSGQGRGIDLSTKDLVYWTASISIELFAWRVCWRYTFQVGKWASSETVVATVINRSIRSSKFRFTKILLLNTSWPRRWWLFTGGFQFVVCRTPEIDNINVIDSWLEGWFQVS